MNVAQPGAGEHSTGLPRRTVGAVRGDGVRVAAPGRHRAAGLLAVVGPALDEVSGQDANINGLIVASTDGLVLAGHPRGVQADTVAAMAAAAASIATQFTERADVGESRASLFEGDSGYVGVFPVEPGVLLVVFGQKDMTMGLFNLAARNALSQLRQAVDRQRTLAARATDTGEDG